jgi:GNAT superfamily N-acetyltransferase
MLPGESTLVANWQALAATSAGARIVRAASAVAAVFPAWEPLNNAIHAGGIDDDEGSIADQVADCADLYADAGVRSWAFWVPSQQIDFVEPDHVVVPTLRRDTTTLVMQLGLDGRHRMQAGVAECSLADALTAGEVPVAAAALRSSDGVPGLTAWVALDGDRAVASLWTFLHEGDCGVYAVGTVPAWRRRGFARRVVEHALHDARQRGARTASLQSTPMAVPLYASLGFEAAGRYEEWVCSGA